MPLASPRANSLPKLEADLLSGPRGMSGESAPMLPRRGPEADKLEKEKAESLNWFGRLLRRIFPEKATEGPIQPVYGVVMLRPPDAEEHPQ